MDGNSRRLKDNVERGGLVRFSVDGEAVEAYEGESLAAALLASGRRTLRRMGPAGPSRGIFCGIGVCFDCAVTVDGLQHVRACVTPVRDGMKVTTIG